MTVTNLEYHLHYRNNRSNSVTINNPKLLGLSAIEINPTELCNRSCSFCPRHDPKIYPNRNVHMSVDTVKILIEQLKEADYTGDINITGFGEPFLNPHILDIAKLFSDNFHTEIMTNGDRILKGHITVSDIEQTGIHNLIIDCYDGADQIQWFSDTLSKYNIKYALRNHHDSGGTELIRQYGFNNRGGALYKSKVKNNPCYYPAYKSFIDYNGDVRICCNDWFRKHLPLGNIHERSFDKIWMDNNFIKTRINLLKGNRKNYRPCDVCDVDGCKIGKSSADVWLSPTNCAN